MTNISLVICHRGNSEERQDNLFHQLKYYDKLFLEIQKIKNDLKFDIFLIEQDVKSKISTLLLDLKNSIPIIHQFCYSDKEFNRSWGLNVGVKLCCSDIVICSDNDIILKKETILSAIEKLLTGKDKYGFPYYVICPYENFLDLNQEQTNIWKQNGKLDFEGLTCRYGRPSDKIIKVGGCFIVKRQFHMDIVGGMDERMEIWGGDDDIYYHKYSRILEHKKQDWNPRLKDNLYHLYHQRVDLDFIRNHGQYKKNCEYIKQICDMSYDNLLKYIEQTKKSIGDINKYKK